MTDVANAISPMDRQWDPCYLCVPVREMLAWMEKHRALNTAMNRALFLACKSLEQGIWEPDGPPTSKLPEFLASLVGMVEKRN